MTTSRAALSSLAAVLFGSTAYATDLGTLASEPSRAEWTTDAGRTDRSARSKRKCALDRFCIGPVLTPGVPHVIGAGVHVRQGDHFGFGIDYQALPSITIADTSVTSSLLTFEGRLYPTGGAFWIGAGFSSQRVHATRTISVPTDDEVAVAGTVTVPALKVGLGLMSEGGLVLGTDAALAIPLSGKTVALEEPEEAAALTAAERQRARALVEERVLDIADTLPLGVQVNVLRLGYLF